MKSRSILIVLYVSLFATINLVFADPAQEIPFRLEQNRIVVQGTIAKHNRLNLIVDTGATTTVIHKKVAKKLGLKKGERKNALVYGQRVHVQEALLPELSLGPVVFNEVPVLIADLNVGLGFRVDGLIGMELLKRKPLAIDYTSKKLSFGSVIHSDSFFRVNARVPLILLCLSVDGGRPLRIMLDTAADDLILYRNQVEGEITASPSPVTKAFWGAEGRPVKVRQVFLSHIEMKDTAWENLPAFFLDTATGAEGFLDGIVGPSALSLKILNLDFHQGLISWTL